MQIQLVTDGGHLGDFVAGWEQLATASHEPRAGAGMVVSWARHMMADDSELHIWIATDGDDVVGVLPFVAEETPRRRQQLVPPATSALYGIIPIALAWRETEIAAALIDAFVAETSRTDLVRLDWIPASSPWLALLDKALCGPDWVALDVPGYVSSYVSLDGGLDCWLGRRSRSFRREFHRRARRLADAGFAPSVTVDPEEIVSRLPLLQRLYGQRKDDRSGLGYAFDERLVATISEALALSSPDRFRMVTIGRAGETIAAELALYAGTSGSGWMTGFDPAWSQLGPGIAAMATQLEAGAAEERRIFDLGVGEERYKADLVDGERPLRSGVWCRPRLARLMQG